MGIRIWLDDVRPMPEGWYDVWVKTAQEAYQYILTGKVSRISFDHDLGDISFDGSWLANQIEALAAEGKIPLIHWEVHSANPVGKRYIDSAMKSALRFWALT